MFQVQINKLSNDTIMPLSVLFSAGLPEATTILSQFY